MLNVADLIRSLAQWPSTPGLISAARSTRIMNAVVDSRQATSGSLFVALRGGHQDGHDFIPAAIANGAVAVIAERPPAAGTCTTLDMERLETHVDGLSIPVCLVVPNSVAALQKAAGYWRQQNSVRVIGITGSVGKTTSKEFISSVLSQRYRTLKSEGNYNNEIGLPLTLLCLTPAHQRVVLEMGMYDLGEIAQLAEIARPQIGVVTNVGPSHLERLGTIERIAQAKAELPQSLPSANEGGIAILNIDDERVRAMAGQTQARVFTYGLSPNADLWADDIESKGLEGTRFRFHYRQETVHARVPMLGRHSVHTALSAAAVGLVEGLSWSDIATGLSDQSVQLRLAATPGPFGSTILDDTYNASPTSCIAALNLLGELSGRKIAVLGDMYELGNYEQEGHNLVGRRARDVVDLLVCVGRLGRIIGQQALEAGMPASAVSMVETNAEAIDTLQQLVEPCDMLLIKGSRSMRMEEIVAALTRSGSGAKVLAKEQ